MANTLEPLIGLVSTDEMFESRLLMTAGTPWKDVKLIETKESSCRYRKSHGCSGSTVRGSKKLRYRKNF